MPLDPLELSTETAQARVASPVALDAPPDLLLAFAQRAFRGAERRPIPPEGLVLGRRADVFGGEPLDDAQLSRRHAEIRQENGQLFVRDLGSRNHTFLNGRKVAARARLGVGDVVRIGGTLVLVCAPQREDAPEIAGGLVGDGAAARRLRRAIEAVAGRASTVL